MSVLLWIVFGALVGWIASMIAGTNEQQGAIGNILVGIVGAFLGGFIVSLFGGAGITGFNIPSVLVAILGAVILLYIMKSLQRGSDSHRV
jgi:uncharacterized membrane protein YeaQ/YmgE (transglycosylase-associated protein family)